MSLKIRNQDLSPAETSFLKWQYGFEEDDDPFEISLWQAIMRAWESDNAPSMSRTQSSDHLSRLGSGSAYPELSGGAPGSPLLPARRDAPYPEIRTKPSLSARLENVLSSTLAKLV